MEDRFDEMLQEKLNAQLKAEAESSALQFDNETGGYSDIDLIFAKKQSEN